MLRTFARMLASCSRALCCPSSTPHQVIPPGSFRLQALGNSSFPRLQQQEQRLLTQPSTLWAAVFQGHLGRSQLLSTAHIHVAAAVGATGPTDSKQADTRPPALGAGAAALQRLRRHRASTTSSSKQPSEVQHGPQNNGTSSSSSAGARKRSYGEQLLAQDGGSVGLSPAGHPQGVQQPLVQQQEATLQQQGSMQDAEPHQSAAQLPLQQQQQQQQQHASSQQSASQTQQASQQQQSTAQPTAQQTKDKLSKGVSNGKRKPGPKRRTTSSKGPTNSSKTAGSTLGSSSDNGTGSTHSSRQNGTPNAVSSSGSSSSSSSNSSSNSSSASAPAGEVSPETTAALQSDFISGGAQQPPLLAPTRPVTEAVLEWASSIELQPLRDWQSVLTDWRAGMAKAIHPFTQQQVDVLALPYYRHGKLVDMRYLHLVDGRLEASWLAAKACEPYMLDQQLQGAQQVVFVGSELDALLLAATQPDWPVIALTHQSPQWFPDEPKQQQLYLQWQQEQHAEDPRQSLVGLRDEVLRLRQEFELGQQRQAMSASAAGLSGSLQGAAAVPDAAVSSPSGLQLLLQQLPRSSSEQGGDHSEQDCVAVIALQEEGNSHVLANELTMLLGELHCRKASWPTDLFTSPSALYQQAVQLALQRQANAAAATDAAAAAAADDPSKLECPVVDACSALALLAGPGVLHSWSVLSVHFLRDYLPGHGGVLDCFDQAIVWPVTGLERFSDLAAELLEYWDQTDITKQQRSTGWPSLNEFYRVVPGEVTVVTGVPNSGKSEWLDALAVNLAENEGWRFAMCSMEKKPRDHARQLLEKRAGKPMLTADYSRGLPQMNEQELADAYDWLCNHFYVIAAGEGSMPSISWVLEKARAAKLQFNIDGLVIDPYNELDPSRTLGFKEHEHVNQTMAMLRKFARDYKVAVWLVAHPRQFGNMWAGQRPGLQDISGGANFANKADNGIVVHRNWARLKELRERAAAAAGKKPPSEGKGRGKKGGQGSADGDADGEEIDPLEELRVEVYVEKVRNKNTGMRGEAVLFYDRASGRYYDEQDPDTFPDWADSIGAHASAHAAPEQQPPASLPLPQQQQQQQQQQHEHEQPWEAVVQATGSNGTHAPEAHGVAVSESEATLELEAQWKQEEERRKAKFEAYSFTSGKSEGINLETE